MQDRLHKWVGLTAFVNVIESPDIRWTLVAVQASVADPHIADKGDTRLSPLFAELPATVSPPTEPAEGFPATPGKVSRPGSHRVLTSVIRKAVTRTDEVFGTRSADPTYAWHRLVDRPSLHV